MFNQKLCLSLLHFSFLLAEKWLLEFFSESLVLLSFQDETEPTFSPLQV